MSLDLPTVRSVAKLARLELSDVDLTKMAEQLNRILDYVDSLSEVDTEGVEPLAHPLPIQNVFREDEPRPSLTPAEALQNAPAKQGQYFGVPAVFDSADMESA
ncbi:MAG: Asp-tRNA(Asn)/Glu-tRNA(Gln) amidotransferase subunit GatC [Fimbriiglobus sp.]